MKLHIGVLDCFLVSLAEYWELLEYLSPKPNFTRWCSNSTRFFRFCSSTCQQTACVFVRSEKKLLLNVVWFIYWIKRVQLRDPVFIAKLKLNRIFAWLYKTFLFASVFGIKFFFSFRSYILYIFCGGSCVPSGCSLLLCVCCVYAIYAPMYTRRTYISRSLSARRIQYSSELGVGYSAAAAAAHAIVVVVIIAVWCVRSNTVSVYR